MYNQYNPWGMNMNPNIAMPQTPQIRRLPKVDWNNFLNNAQRTLGIINQAIPIVNQMRPIVNNARTLFKIAGAMNDEKPRQRDSYQPQEAQNIVPNQENSNLQFFL